jgi:hypothetical protein
MPFLSVAHSLPLGSGLHQFFYVLADHIFHTEKDVGRLTRASKPGVF